MKFISNVREKTYTAHDLEIDDMVFSLESGDTRSIIHTVNNILQHILNQKKLKLGKISINPKIQRRHF